MIEVLNLLISMFIVFLAAIFFVNAIEYIGCKFYLGSSFVGAIVAPIFTSLPEMIVFIVALFGGAPSGERIGIGTIFGQPFMASSLSYGLVGIMVLLGYYLKRRDSPILKIDKSLIVPYAFITVLYPTTLLPSFFGFHKFFSIFFLFTYLMYVYVMYKKGITEIIEDAESPYFCKIIPNPVGVIAQLSFAVVLLYIGSHELVNSVDILAREMGISALGLALIVVPAATAIPETASALIWGFRGKDTLSMGSLIGEKILYSTFYPGLGLLLTSWVLDIHAYLSVLATTIISFILLVIIYKQKVLWWELCIGLFFFICYVVLIFFYNI